MYKSVLALLMMLGSVTFAQELTGKVIDAETRQGVPGAKVWIRSIGAGVKTDVEGDFRIDFSLPE
ncbi:MAG: carboxypeptidase-like regulatory domain-containing protein, partial [Crocinitomicaceae bacterium]